MCLLVIFFKDHIVEQSLQAIFPDLDASGPGQMLLMPEAWELSHTKTMALHNGDKDHN